MKADGIDWKRVEALLSYRYSRDLTWDECCYLRCAIERNLGKYRAVSVRTARQYAGARS